MRALYLLPALALLVACGDKDDGTDDGAGDGADVGATDSGSTGDGGGDDGGGDDGGGGDGGGDDDGGTDSGGGDDGGGDDGGGDDGGTDSGGGDDGGTGTDADGDGYTADVDCDDDDREVHPGADEVCDGVDNDCDDLVDDADPDAVLTTFYPDRDGDGYGNDDGAVDACEAGDTWVEVGGDCDDLDGEVNPGADEVCDEDDVDEDCDGRSDDDDPDATGLLDWYEDEDGDGYGGDEVGLTACDAGTGWATESGDCDDSDPDVLGFRTWYRDLDGDGYGDDDVTDTSCTAPEDYVDVGGDCNDLNSRVFPTATEICNDTDDDCDDLVDDDDDDVDAESSGTAFYEDLDDDGYGDTTVYACEIRDGLVRTSGDCDDDDDAIHPGATEICSDGVDDNCNDSPDDCAVADADEELDDAADASIVVDSGWAENSWYLVFSWDLDGDHDGDGNKDLLTGAYGVYDREMAVFEGPFSGERDTSAPDASLAYRSTGVDLGNRQMWVGDIDGDGYDDALSLGHYSSYGSASVSGYARLFLGPLPRTGDEGDADFTVWGTADYDQCGADGAAGDLDDDGDRDLLVFCHGQDAVHLFSSPSSGSGAAAVVADATITLDDTTSGTGFAGRGPVVGDLDGDGVDDFVYPNAYNESQRGDVFAIFGPITGDVSRRDADTSGEGATTTTRLGYDHQLYDVDGDGTLDLALTSEVRDDPAISVWLGGSDVDLSDDADMTTYGPGSYDIGEVFEFGDVNGDGHADLIGAMPEYDEPASYSGGVLLWYGPLETGSTFYSDYDSVRIAGTAGRDYTGSTLQVTDVDDDGYDDIIAGRAYWIGTSDATLWILEGGWY